MTELVLVLTTVPTELVGETIASALLDASLAACVNVLPPMTSIYRWQGAIERSVECQLVAKTTRALVGEVEARIRELHPYELPEFLIVSIDDGGADYLAWVRASVSIRREEPT